MKNIEKENSTLEEKLEVGIERFAKKNQKDISVGKELSRAKEFIIKLEWETCEKRFENKSDCKDI